MSTVWVLTAGEYSDYHLVGVYSTKEKADQISKLAGRDCNNPFSVVIDEGLDKIELGLNPFTIRMSKDGKVLSSHTYFYWNDMLSDVRWCYGNMFDDSFDLEVWAKDLEHAIKIVNEKRIYLIANNLYKSGKIEIA